MPRRAKACLPQAGSKFNRLTLVRQDGLIEARFAGVFRCDCGKEVRAPIASVEKGNPKSCGCFRSEMTRARGLSNRGRTRPRLPVGERAHEHPAYYIWQGLRQRCKNPNAPSFALYGGRGITVCGRWEKSFEAFCEDMGERPSRRHSIERLDVNAPYEPGNCVWATSIEQSNNKRGTVYVEHNGRKQALAYWSRELGIGYNTLLARLKKGWPPERVLSKQFRP